MGLRVAILRFSYLSIFSMLKTLKIQKNGKNIVKKSIFSMKKILHIKTFKLQLLGP